MYSVYKIYQADKLVLITYSDIIPEFTDTTKLKLILNGPTIPISLFESYFKHPELFSITTHEIGIYNALDANQIVQEQARAELYDTTACEGIQLLVSSEPYRVCRRLFHSNLSNLWMQLRIINLRN